MFEILEGWSHIFARFAHVLAAITWIGSSFYFNWLDILLPQRQGETRMPNPRGQLGEVHGGSFYYHERFWPAETDPELKVHAGPSQLTLLTGILLLALVYWVGADIYLIDRSVMAMTQWQAIALSAGSIAAGWLIYHLVCDRVKSDRTLAIVFFVAIYTVSYFYFSVFGARAAVLHLGALFGAIMSLNVSFVIVPCHIGMRKQLEAKTELDRELGYRAKRRSQHNNYLTLPVLFCMLAIHFSMGSGHKLAWLIIPTTMLALFLARLIRNCQLSGAAYRGYQLAAVALVLVAIGVMMFTGRISSEVNASDVISDEQAMVIVNQRCSTCHSANPTDKIFKVAPLGFIVDDLEQVKQSKDLIRQRSIVDGSMPPGNLSGMTDDERASLGQWLMSIK